MENESVVEAPEAAERSFERAPETIEEGLDVEDAQLRRACRLLAAASHLLDMGYYTVVIESSFVAIERTIQFRLIHDGAMSGSEVISSHRRIYQRGAEVGLYDDAFADRLAELWNQNRTKTYYRLGIATETQPRRCRASPPRCIGISSTEAGSPTSVSVRTVPPGRARKARPRPAAVKRSPSQPAHRDAYTISPTVLRG